MVKKKKLRAHTIKNTQIFKSPRLFQLGNNGNKSERGDGKKSIMLSTEFIHHHHFIKERRKAAAQYKKIVRSHLALACLALFSTERPTEKKVE